MIIPSCRRSHSAATRTAWCMPARRYCRKFPGRQRLEREEGELPDRNVVVVAGELVVIGHVAAGVDAGEFPEVVDEMRLVKESTVERNLCPIDCAAARDLLNGALESANAAK